MLKEKEMLWHSTPFFSGYQFFWILTSIYASPPTGYALKLLK
jgi:hypothetical protein